MGPIFRRSLIDLIEKEVPSWFGPGGLCQGSKSLSWNYFGCGSETQSHVTDSGGSNLCFGERDSVAPVA